MALRMAMARFEARGGMYPPTPLATSSFMGIDAEASRATVRDWREADWPLPEVAQSSPTLMPPLNGPPVAERANSRWWVLSPRTSVRPRIFGTAETLPRPADLRALTDS